MSDKIEALGLRVVGAVRDYVARATDKLEKVLDAISRRVSTLEARVPERGEKGDQGDRGPVGEKGADGLVGPAGKDGERGPAGEKGADGLAGPVGSHGVDGGRGPQGEKGIDGKDGSVGPVGPQGIDGKDGAAGPQGEKGADGSPGSIGPVGPQGEKGADGKDGLPGPAGPVGEKGTDGRDGRDGRKGEDGRDALSLSVVPFIDPDKSYPAGTWARHRGGLVHALRSTDALITEASDFVAAGWEVVVEGLAFIGALEAGDVRYFTLAMQLTSGKQAELPFTVPSMIYRGVWTEKEFERGDTVTWNGCLWHCEVDTTKSKPGTPGNTDWKLCVKSGRDGKDGKRTSGS